MSDGWSDQQLVMLPGQSNPRPSPHPALECDDLNCITHLTVEGVLPVNSWQHEQRFSFFIETTATRLGVRAPCGQRVRALLVKNGLISCSWLHLLKVWSLLKTRGDSIRYAAAVHLNQLPKVSPKHGFKDFAVLWEPKDTIGGDTWWLSSEDSPGPVTLAVIDCTGHGVPGAMTAMLVSNTLSRLFAENPFCTLEATAAGIGQALAQSFGSFDKNSDVANGCDLVLIQQVPQSHQLRLGLAAIDVMHYRSAEKKLDWVESPRNGSSAKPSADLQMAIRNIDYSAGDRLLITTDGLTDQVGGGEKLRSFGYGRTKAILESTPDQSVHGVVASLLLAMDTWRGIQERRDDVTLICIDLGTPPNQ